MGMASVLRKEREALQVISAYQPNGPDKGGPYTVYAQHLRHLLYVDKDNLRDPWLVFLLNLKKQVTEWMQAGDQIVVGIDANNNL
jgi:hypothetical protein